MCKFRDLAASEIETRAQSVSERGLQLLLYKDARVDMNILDETVGPSNWQREHYECKGNLFCRVGINVNFDKNKEPLWIWKADCGTESNTKAQKGEASDSFKRACVNWGIGRELYSAPFIWVKAADVELKEYTVKGEKKYKTYDKFSVTDITISNGIIKALKIKNDRTGATVYTYGYSANATAPTPPRPDKLQQPQVPFPEAEPITYENALTLVLTEGNYNGRTLQELYRIDFAYVQRLYKDPSTPDKVRRAIGVINAEITRYKAAQK